jgi:hypothetical protein
MALMGDEFFSTEQQRRLQELMSRWRAAREANEELSPAQQAELEALVDAELAGATLRAAALVRDATLAPRVSGP